MKYIWLFPVKSKSGMKEFFTNYILSVPNQFQLRIKILYTNGEIEYIGLTFTLLNFGIQHLISPTYSPKKDETAERKLLHVPDTTLNLFHHASIPLKFFSSCSSMQSTSLTGC